MIVNSVIYSRTTGQKVCQVDIHDIAKQLKNPDHFLWLGLKEPTEELMQRVRSQLNLHELAVEDAHRAHQRTKLDEYDDSFFLTMHTAEYEINSEQHHIQFGETHVFAGINFIVSVRHGHSASYTSVRQRCEQNPRMLMRGPGYVVYALMDYVVDNYFPVVDTLIEQLDLLQKRIFANKISKKTIHTLFENKRELAKLQLGITPLLDVCNQLMLMESPIVPQKMLPYYRDVHDHILRIHDTIKVINEMLTTALDVHIALVTTSQNETVKRLASWAGLLAVPTMFASFWGMNFNNMPELDWKYGYPAALLAMATVSFLLFRSFKKNGWL